MPRKAERYADPSYLIHPSSQPLTHCPFNRLPICPSIHLFIHPSNHPTTYLSTYPSVHPSIHPSMYPLTYPSIYSLLRVHSIPDSMLHK